MSDPLLARVRALDAALEGLQARVQHLERRQARTPPEAAGALLGAIADVYGGSRFTASTLLAWCDDDPHSDLANAIGDVIELNASRRSQATQLGLLLSRLPDVECTARSRGVAVYRMVDGE